MVETISPVVYGTRTKWVGAVALHALGAAATAAAFGAVLAASSAALGAPWGRAGVLAVGVVALLYAGRELLGLRIPVPQLRRQVPDWWRTYFGRPLAAFLYGAGLGIGFLTFLGHGTLVAVTLGAAATGRPGLGALVMLPFGLARGLAPLVAARAREPEDGGRLVDRLNAMDDRTRSLVNGAALVGVAAAAAAAGWSASGGWGRAAAAALALIFGWAAVSKLLGMRRWRRSLADHGLPSAVEGAGVWAVPVVEALVPALVVLGRERAAAALAAAALVAFSLALVRAARRDGARVPCGCFGRSSVDVRLALGRNAALAALAVSVWAVAPPDPPLAFPAGGDVLPVVLAAGALLAAATTAWLASTWLSRGRG